MIAEPWMPARADSSLLQLSILVVDDDRYVYELLADTFADDYTVLLASEGTTALELAASEPPDLILLDVMMPGMNGFEICSRLKSEDHTRHIPVIFLTGAADSEAESRGLEMGATDFVSKPINSAALRARVNNQMNLRRAQDQLLRVANQKHKDDLAAELERYAAKDRAKSLELQLKDQLLSHVSHELRAPLTAIYLFVSLMADRLAGAITPQQDDYLRRTLENVEQMKAMVDDLLDTANIRNGKVHLSLKRVVLSEAVEFTVNAVRPAASAKTLRITARESKALHAAYADPVRVRQILKILLENAVKFTPREGAIEIAIDLSATDLEFLVVEISDTGCGVSPEVRENLFERLYQADSSDRGRMGLGLGLHIAKQLVAMQGGTIWVESVLEKGSTFRFTLPVFNNQPETPSLLDEFDS